MNSATRSASVPHVSPSCSFALLAVVAASLLAACGGGGGAGGGVAESSPPPTAAAAADATLAVSQPGELLAYVKTRLAERATQRADTPEITFTSGGSVTADAAGSTVLASSSGTTVQEAGVDEDDLLKTDGQWLYTVAPLAAPATAQPNARLQVWQRAADGAVSASGSLNVMRDGEATALARGLLLASGAQRVAVVGESHFFYSLDLCAGDMACPATTAVLPAPQRVHPSVHVDLVGVADPTAPALLERWQIDGRLIGTRLIGTRLYVVTQHTPELAVEALPASAKDSERQALLARLTTAELLPTIRINGGAAQPLVADTECFVQPRNAALGIEITSVTVVDLAAVSGSSALPTRRSSRCFAGGSEAVYVSPDSLYVATTRTVYKGASSTLVTLPAQMNTDVHKFALASGVPDYRGSATVAGHLGWDVARKSYRMSEWMGDLRVLTFSGQTGWGAVADAHTVATSPAQLTVLRERVADKTLQVVSVLPNAQRPKAIGKPGEQLYGVRFAGARGYAVTFRRTDPLYVLDLSDPADPKTAGELEVTGYSDALFPLEQGLLLGVGKEADADGRLGGVKISLFDVADAASPRLIESQVFGGAGSASALDVSPHGINLFTRSGTTRVALPMALRSSVNELPQRGLQRLEVNLATRSLNSRPALRRAGPEPVQADLSTDRSVQIEDTLYYFSGGSLTAWDW